MTKALYNWLYLAYYVTAQSQIIVPFYFFDWIPAWLFSLDGILPYQGNLIAHKAFNCEEAMWLEYSSIINKNIII